MGVEMHDANEATEIHEVALGNFGEDDYNTLVLTGIDLVVPLEMDVDGDPLQDDEVRLSSEHGYWSRVLRVSDADVVPDPTTRLLLYRFRFVPPGVYRLATRVGGRWSPLASGIVVTREGAFFGGQPLSDEPPTTGAAVDESSDVDPEGDGGDDGHADCCGH